MIKVTVWNEFVHEKENAEIGAVYPDGIHGAIAGFLTDKDISVRTATLEEPECGLTEEVLRDTDVLVWWGHIRHGDVPGRRGRPDTAGSADGHGYDLSALGPSLQALPAAVGHDLQSVVERGRRYGADLDG